jgi:hypothetical protein
MLVEFGAAIAPFDARAVCAGKVPMRKGFGMGNETYGKDSKLYLRCPNKETRRKLEDFLRINDVTTVERRYWPESSIVEVGVTYFKGRHWDE